MFSRLFRCIHAANTNEFNSKTVRCFLTSANLAEQRHAINKVEMVGTIYKHLFTLPSGYKSYILQTVEPGNKYYYHMVGTGTKSLCAAGQRVHFVGRLSSQNFWTEKKQIRQKVIIKAGEFQLLADAEAQQDVNRVEIYSQIASEINNQSDCSSFTMTTQHTPKGGRRSGIFVTEYHRVLVRSPDILELVRYQLKKCDWINVKGRISYTFSKNSKDKLRQSGYILANSIQLKSDSSS